MTSLLNGITSALDGGSGSSSSSITSASSISSSSISPSSVSTSTLPPSTSVTSVAPSTTTVPPSSSIQPVTVVTSVTSVITESPTAATATPVVTTIYSTQPVVTYTPSAASASTASSSSSSSSSSPTALTANGDAVQSKGLSSGATIAIAVIIPIAAVIGLVVLGLWFWRRRKARKNTEELRKSEMAEYGYNPNQDPTLPVAAYTDNGSDGNDDSGYRGWGATSSTARKPSTTMGSNSRAAAMAGVAASDSGSHGYQQPSPDAPSGDPLVGGYTEAGAVGAGMAAGAAASRNRYSGIHRGPSNASSQYSNAGPAMSEGESEHHPSDYYNNEVPYNIYNDVQQPSGPYTDGFQQGDQPVIRDVQARRNTRIERAPTFPQQGGIAQNF